jgi:hypothetical protein
MEAIATIPLSKVSTVQELKDAIGERHLVMFTKFDYYNELDARKKHLGNWTKFYVLRVKDNKIEYYSPVAGDLNWFCDKITVVHESFRKIKIDYFEKVELEEAKMLNLFLYNRKKKNTIFLTDGLLPNDLKEELALLLKNAGECIKAGYQIMRQGTNNTSKHGFTYKSVPKNEVVCRSGDYTGITYVVKEVRYVFGHEYHDRCEIKEVDPYFGINGWARCSRSFNSSNSNYGFYKVAQKDVNQMHILFQNAIEHHSNFCKKINEWRKSLEVVCS